jgi:hypothetical protein
MNQLFVVSSVLWLSLTPGFAPLSSPQPLPAAPVAKYLSVSGAGIGTDPDRGTAHDAADSMAQSNLQTSCNGGELQSTRKIFDQCSQLNDNYVCNVNYSAICKIGN